MLRERKEREVIAERRDKKALDAAAKLSAALDGFEVEIPQKVNEQGGLYGSVQAQVIADALKKQKFAVTSDMVSMREPIKEAGDYSVTINLPHGFEALVTIHIVSKGKAEKV